MARNEYDIVGSINARKCWAASDIFLRYFRVYADDVNLLGDSIGTIKKNRNFN
jgi:hypothetical protein